MNQHFHHHFKSRKAIESILFIAERLANAAPESVCQLMYLAEKQHLQNWGRMLCNDVYTATPRGPMPSSISIIIKYAERLTLDPSIVHHLDWGQDIQDAMSVAGLRSSRIIPKRPVNGDLLSESEVECLEHVLREHGDLTIKQRALITCDSAWLATGKNEPVDINDIIATLPNGGEVFTHYHSHRAFDRKTSETAACAPH